jgi:hypothetical protein
METKNQSDVWYSDADNPFPTNFTDKTVKLVHETICDDAGLIIAYSWNGQRFSVIEWETKWSDDKFPRLFEHPHESVSYRSKCTTKIQNIRYCWDNSFRINHPCSWSSSICTFIDSFRVDMYGNVISIEAYNGALTKFDVDHIYPWSRGGRSLQRNFAAVQYHANRSIKSDNLVQNLSKPRMKCGITEEQLISIVQYIIYHRSQSRLETKNCLNHLKNWLCQFPLKGTVWTNFQEKSLSSDDGKTLWFFLVNNAKKDIDQLLDITLFKDATSKEEKVEDRNTNIVVTTTFKRLTGRKNDGNICGSCLLTKSGFCHWHTSQDPNCISTNNNDHVMSSTSQVMTVGRRKDGNICGNCMKIKSGFCHSHKKQDPQYNTENNIEGK